MACFLSLNRTNRARRGTRAPEAGIFAALQTHRTALHPAADAALLPGRTVTPDAAPGGSLQAGLGLAPAGPAPAPQAALGGRRSRNRLTAPPRARLGPPRCPWPAEGAGGGGRGQAAPAPVPVPASASAPAGHGGPFPTQRSPAPARPGRWGL